MTPLDGNSLAGALVGVLGREPTTSVLLCAHCGSLSELGRVRVFSSAMGAVVRCSDCDEVLITVVDAGGGVWIRMAGVRAFTPSV